MSSMPGFPRGRGSSSPRYKGAGSSATDGCLGYFVALEAIYLLARISGFLGTDGSILGSAIDVVVFATFLLTSLYMATIWFINMNHTTRVVVIAIAEVLLIAFVYFSQLPK